MKKIILIGLIAGVTAAYAGPARQQSRTAPRNPPPPVFKTEVRPAPAQEFVYEQHSLQGHPSLIDPEKARAIVEQFKEAYPKLGSPRMLVYVNRDLVDQTTGIQLTSQTQRTDTRRTQLRSDFERDPNARTEAAPSSINVTAGGNVTVDGGGGFDPAGKGNISTRTDRVTTETRYRNQTRQETLADRQTVRDVERLFGRPLRAGGVTLADQRIATQLIADRPLKEITGRASTETEAARKDREALAKIADVVLEVLISSRNITVNEISGPRVHTIPDIQATAIRLSDSQILAQASAADVLGPDRYAGPVARMFHVQEIAEATALALMEDMMLGLR